MSKFCNKISTVAHTALSIGLILIVGIEKASSTTLSPSQIDALIAETKALRTEVVQLRTELKRHTKEHKSSLITTRKSSSPNKASHTKLIKKPAKAAPAKGNNHPTAATQHTQTSNSKSTTQKSINLGGFPVLLSPDLGSTPAYDGSDLLTNMAQQNGDLLSLQYRQEIENTNAKDSNYYLVLSGSLGGQVYNTKDYTGPQNSDIDLVTANISALAAMGKWMTGFLSIDYDNAPPSGFYPEQIGPRALNSRLYLEQGYMTIGNLNSSNWYASIGQMYLPFGAFNGFMINSPLTSSLFSTTERPALLGYSHSTDTTELDLEAYVYQGETVTRPNTSTINEWGAGASYTITEDNWNGSIGLGYLSNIADAEGLQLNGQGSSSCTLFAGFAFPCKRSNLLAHRVPGFDLYANYTINAYSFIAEYLTATEAFSPLDMTYNHRGAKPQGFDVEAAYAFSVRNKPSSIAIGYTVTKESLALLLPAQEYSIALNTSLWRNTVESLGFQHDINYGRYDVAGGQNLPVLSASDRLNLGKTSNTIIFAINTSF